MTPPRSAGESDIDLLPWLNDHSPQRVALMPLYSKFACVLYVLERGESGSVFCIFFFYLGLQVGDWFKHA